MFPTGHLEVVLPGGRRLTVGDGGAPRVALEIADRLTLARIMAQPSLGVGEAYMAGKLTLTRGSMRDLVELAMRHGPERLPGARPGALARGWARLARERNARVSARRNVHHHYDLSVDLYRAFLDEDLQYSCAYFETPDADLESAQRAKKRHIAGKLDLAAGQRVLDIGCGWGGMALSLAAWTGASVDGVTLSEEQLRTARTRAEAAGLSHLARFSLTDYRDVAGPYDRIVSVGMFEHVGRPNYQAFFDKIGRLLKPDGVALIHSIGRADGPSTTDPFTAKYIFPGGYIPALSEVLHAVERAGLWVTDIEILRLHYAETLRHWHERFMARRAEIAAMYDERFCRMWEFYLVGAEMGFRHGDHMNFQLQLTKRVDALPITRGYMEEGERALARVERRVA
ncbi:MAG: cyclopropane-fatty-acyl-phospholipid synthase family protein [Caulobacteraceae bacterium]